MKKQKKIKVYEEDQIREPIDQLQKKKKSKLKSTGKSRWAFDEDDDFDVEDRFRVKTKR